MTDIELAKQLHETYYKTLDPNTDYEIEKVWETNEPIRDAMLAVVQNAKLRLNFDRAQGIHVETQPSEEDEIIQDPNKYWAREIIRAQEQKKEINRRIDRIISGNIGHTDTGENKIPAANGLSGKLISEVVEQTAEKLKAGGPKTMEYLRKTVERDNERLKEFEEKLEKMSLERYRTSALIAELTRRYPNVHVSFDSEDLLPLFDRDHESAVRGEGDRRGGRNPDPSDPVGEGPMDEHGDRESVPECV